MVVKQDKVTSEDSVYKRKHEGADLTLEEIDNIGKDTQEVDEPSDNVDTSFISNKQKADNEPNAKELQERYDHLRSFNDRKIGELTSEVNSLRKQLVDGGTKEVVRFPATEAELQAMAKQYPDMVRVFETIAMKKGGMTQKDRDDFETLKKRTKKLDRKEAELNIKTAHNDFDKLTKDQEFLAWLDTQSEYLQDTLYDNPTFEPTRVISTIDLYKLQKGLTTVKKEDRQNFPQGDDGATFIKTNEGPVVQEEIQDSSGKKVWRTSEIKKLGRREYEKYHKEIDQARREGRLLKDTR